MFKKIYIEISNSCNFNCSFCYKSKRKKRFLNICEFEEITEKIKPFTRHIYLHVLGEPLLHPNLKDFLEIAEKQNLSVNITTNGSLIEKQKEILAQANIRQLNISLHDWEENILDFETKLTNLIPIIQELSTKMYVCFRLWNQTNNESYNFNKKCLDILKKELDISDIQKSLTNGNGTTLAPNIFLQNDNRFCWPDLNNEPFYKEKNCYALRDHIAILSDGTVVPCCLDANANLALGNIFEQSLDKILQSERTTSILNGFRQHKAIEPFCQTCGFMTHGA